MAPLSPAERLRRYRQRKKEEDPVGWSAKNKEMCRKYRQSLIGKTKKESSTILASKRKQRYRARRKAEEGERQPVYKSCQVQGTAILSDGKAEHASAVAAETKPEASKLKSDVRSQTDIPKRRCRSKPRHRHRDRGRAMTEPYANPVLLSEVSPISRLAFRRCFARGCHNNSINNPKINFFRYPINDSGRLRQWMLNSHRLNTSKDQLSRSYLCEDHFNDSQFICIGMWGCASRRGDQEKAHDWKRELVLKPSAVPTVFLITPFMDVSGEGRREVEGTEDAGASQPRPVAADVPGAATHPIAQQTSTEPKFIGGLQEPVFVDIKRELDIKEEPLDEDELKAKEHSLQEEIQLKEEPLDQEEEMRVEQDPLRVRLQQYWETSSSCSSEESESSLCSLVSGLDHCPGSRTNKTTREAILTLFENGYMISEIAQRLSIARTTVRRWIKRHQDTGDVETRPRGGRPRCTTAEEDEAILQVDPDVPATSIRSSLGLQCSAQTIRNRHRREKDKQTRKPKLS